MDPYMLTGSTSIFEQKKHTHRKILIVFVKNPTWYTGLASSMCPKWPGHSVILPAHVWQRAVLSIVPCRGSMRPPSFGRPPSVVSGYLIPPSVTDKRLCRKTGYLYISYQVTNFNNHKNSA